MVSFHYFKGIKKRGCLGLSIVLLFLSACRGVPAEQVKTEFTKEELLADYDQMWEDLWENYPFFPAMEEKGIDPETVYRESREILIKNVSDFDAFLSLLNTVFSQMDYLAHLSVVDVGVYDASYSYNEAYGVLDEGTKNDSDSQTRAIYEMLRDKNAVSDISADEKEVDMQYFSDLKTAYFHFKSFDTAYIERDRTVICDYLSTLEHVENIIIDITGNRGGDSRYWYDCILVPFGGEYQSEFKVFLSDTPVNEHRFFGGNGGEIQSVWELTDADSVPQFVKELGMTHYGIQRLEITADTTEWSAARRWVLIDGGVYSAADSFAGFCKDSGWATLVGEQTMGDGDLVSPVSIRLENTGLLVRFSSTCRANADGTCNSLCGTSPDVSSKSVMTPLRKCLQLIAVN